MKTLIQQKALALALEHGAERVPNATDVYAMTKDQIEALAASVYQLGQASPICIHGVPLGNNFSCEERAKLSPFTSTSPEPKGQ